MKGYREQARAVLDSLKAARPSERKKIDIALVYYGKTAWSALNPDDPNGRLKHRQSMDWLAREIGALGMAVKAGDIDLASYRRWLDFRQDTRDLRAEYVASNGYRIGMMIDTNSIGWCAILEEHDVKTRVYGGSAVRSNRRFEAFSQRDYADLHGLGVRTLQRIEAGKELPPLSLVLELVKGRREWDIYSHI